MALFVGCATSSAPDVAVRLEQLTPTSDFRFAGPVSVQFRVTVDNDTESPVTLSRLELRTIGPGAYALREPAMPLHLAVPAKSSASVVVTARGASSGGNPSSVEPVNVRGTAYFDAPGGGFARVVNATFGQR